MAATAEERKRYKEDTRCNLSDGNKNGDGLEKIFKRLGSVSLEK